MASSLFTNGTKGDWLLVEAEASAAVEGPESGGGGPGSGTSGTTNERAEGPGRGMVIEVGPGIGADKVEAEVEEVAEAGNSIATGGGTKWAAFW